MMKGAGKQRKTGAVFLLGAAMVILFSLPEGFSPTFFHMLAHLRLDLSEWQIHFYLLGWLLIAYGAYRLVRKR